MFKQLLLILGLFAATPVAAQQVTCATRPSGDSSNACASTAFVNQYAPLPLSVTNGGTGASTFTQYLPLIGNGTGAIAQGTRSGNTTTFGTTIGTLTNGHCASFDSNGNLIDAGGGCLSSYILWANDFGAVCNGAGDDHVAFQNAINSAISTGKPLRFFGNCKITTGLTVTGALDFGGDGRQQAILTMGADADTITITGTNPVQFHDFYMTYSVGSTHSNIIISPPSGENQYSDFRNLFLANANNGLNTIRASLWHFHNNTVFNFSGNGVIVENLNNADSGDSYIEGSEFVPATAANAAIQYISSGGLRVLNNKLVGSNTINYGFQLSLASGVNTSDLFIIGNSFEQTSLANAIYLKRASTTGTFTNVVISGNECLSTYCITIPTDGSGVWLSTVTISNNVATLSNSASAVGYYIDSSTGVAFNNNAITSNNSATIPTYIGSTVTGKITATSVVGTAAAAIYGSSTAVIDDAFGLTLLHLPSTAANGSRIFITDGAPASNPCTGSSTGSTAFRQNGAWKCF